MTKQVHSDYESLSLALWLAKKNGYRVPPLEQAIFTSAGAEKLEGSLRRWATGLLFDKEFAIYLFGQKPVDKNGFDIMAIKIWAKQYAVEFQGRIYEARDRREMTFLEMPEIDFDFTESAVKEAPPEIVECHKVVKRLEDLMITIPFTTHRVEDVAIIGTIPEYEYHLKQMAVADNPFNYVREFVNEHRYGR
jgi:hypothetical protein